MSTESDGPVKSQGGDDSQESLGIPPLMVEHLQEKAFASTLLTLLTLGAAAKGCQPILEGSGGVSLGSL